jgi:hypothetical protein
MARLNPKEFRRRLHELAETQGWVHHVGNLDTGQLLTFPLDRPVAPLSRAQRLSRLGHPFDPLIFGGPRYKLTARTPYLASPKAGLIIDDSPDYPYYYYDTYWFDAIIWQVSEAPVPPVDGNIRFIFSVSSELGINLITVSLPFSAAWPGKVGHITLWNYADQTQRTRIPITSNAAHTVDLIFTPEVPRGSADIRMAFETGIQFVTFESISFGPTLLPPTAGEIQL